MSAMVSGMNLMGGLKNNLDPAGIAHHESGGFFKNLFANQTDPYGFFSNTPGGMQDTQQKATAASQAAVLQQQQALAGAAASTASSGTTTSQRVLLGSN